MKRKWLVVAALVLAAGTARADLKINEMKVVYFPLGPERPAAEFYPFEDIFIRYSLEGFKKDASGEFSVDVTVDLLDPSGKVLKHGTQTGTGSFLLGPTIINLFHMAVPPKLSPGDYRIKLTCKDNISGKSVTREKEVTVKAREFAILSPQFYFDPDGKVLAPNGGLAGQHLTIVFWGIGLDNEAEKIDLVWTMDLLDENRVKIKRLLQQEKTLADPAIIKELPWITMTTKMPLTSPGKFYLRVSLRDCVRNKIAHCEFPLIITMPPETLDEPQATENHLTPIRVHGGIGP